MLLFAVKTNGFGSTHFFEKNDTYQLKIGDLYLVNLILKITIMKLKRLPVALLCATIATSAMAQQRQVSGTDVPLVFGAENTGAAFAEPVMPAISDLTPCVKLPDPFAWADGSGRSEDYNDWEKRRNEIRAQIEHYEIGPRPKVDRSDITATYANGQLTIVVKRGDKSLTMKSPVTMPSGNGPHPVIIGMNNPTGTLSAGLFPDCIQIAFKHDDVSTYGSLKDTDPYYTLYPEYKPVGGNSTVGQYSAWSWGVSRIIDAIEMLQDELNADLSHIAVSGCSYAGKMALYSGAFDERVALTFAQESGGGGVNSWRASQAFTKRTGTSVEKLDNTDYKWFCSSLRQFAGKEQLLPYDHHELVAMIAPRAVLVLGNPDYEWLGDESGYISTNAAIEVWKTWGIEDRIGYVYQGGHSHCQASDDQNTAVTTFADRFLRNKEANTKIRIAQSAGTVNFETADIDGWVSAWKKPADPRTPSIKISSDAADELVAPASIKVVANVTDIDNDVTCVTFYKNQVKIAVDSTAPYECVLTDLTPGQYNISAEAVDALGFDALSNYVSVTVVAPVINITKATAAPKIDGEVDDAWKAEGVQAIEAATALVGDYDAADVSGSIKLLWDEVNLYFLAEITDDALVNDGSTVYEDDNIELYFDCDYSHGSSYNTDDVQYSFRWNDTKISTIPSSYSTKGINFVTVATEKGWNCEGQIPWTTIKNVPANNKKIGFEFMINDDDDHGSRDAKLAWNSAADNAWSNPSFFGAVVIVGDVDASLIPKPETETEKGDGISQTQTEVSVYPNPATDVVNVMGINGEFEYKVLDATGRELKSGKSQKSVLVGNLEKGTYILQVKNATQKRNVWFIKR